MQFSSGILCLILSENFRIGLSVAKLNVFILTDEWDDYSGKNFLRFYGVAENSIPVEIIVDNYKPFFFVNRHTPDFSNNSQPVKINFPHLRRQTELKSFSLLPSSLILKMIRNTAKKK